MPETRYAKTRDGVHIAYQVVGDGPLDLVFANSWCSHVEVSWDRPAIVRFYEHLSSFCRLVLFDKRGTGLSDPVSGVPTMEDRMDDIRAVMDAIGSEQAALLGTSEGAPTCAVFAATYPERTSALVLFAPFIVGLADEECPWAWTREFWDRLSDAMESTWGTPDGSGVEFVTPSLIGDDHAREWYAHYFRSAASPATALALLRVNTEIDIRPVLPTVGAPTLVMHRTDEVWINGLHTGELELRDRDIGGIAVHIGQRVSSAAGAGEVMVSSTVKDLVAGSQIRFDDRGEHQLKGVPGIWHLFRVAS